MKKKLFHKLPKLAIAIVAYKHREAVLDILVQLKPLNIPIFVTENNGNDGTAEAIKQRHPEVTLLESPANLGGCGGFNCSALAALNSGCDYLLYLDDDALPAEDCIEQLVDFLESHPDFVFAAPAIYMANQPDTLQETGGGVDFSRSLPIEAWNRFRVNPSLPPVLEVDYASACCLMVRADALRKIGVMDWAYFIFSDDVDLCLRLRQHFGKGACITTAKAYHDFPWGKPFSPMRLYFFQRNGLRLISTHGINSVVPKSLWVALMRLYRRIFYSFCTGDTEIYHILRVALGDAWQNRYGHWQNPIIFGKNRNKLSQADFQRDGIKRILIDISIEDFDQPILSLIHQFDPQATVDILCDAHRTSVYQQKCPTSTIWGRVGGFIKPLKIIPTLLRQRYDLVITDANMEPRRPTAHCAKKAAIYHDGALYSAAARPWLAAFCQTLSLPLAGLAATFSFQHFMKLPIPGKPPQEAETLLKQINIDPEIGQPWAPLAWTEASIAKPTPNIHTSLLLSKPLGDGTETGGYPQWCAWREKEAPKWYTQTHAGHILFSIIVPVYNTPIDWLKQCIYSVRTQTFADWELILCDDASNDTKPADYITKMAAKDPRISFIRNDQPSGISITSNRAAALAKGTFIVFLDHDDRLNRFALTAFAEALADNPDLDLLYADEDRFDETYQRFQPGFKPDYSPIKLLGTNYIHHPLAIRRSLFEQLGGFRSEYDGSQDYDLLLRATEVSDRIAHIPDVLYHMRLHSGSLASGPEAKPVAHERGRQAVLDHLQRMHVKAEVISLPTAGHHAIVRALPETKPRISLLLLNDDHDFDQTLAASVWGEAHETFVCNTTTLSRAARLNALAAKTTGDLLVMASATLKPEPDWQAAILPYMAMENIGIATIKLIYQDGTLFSNGLILGMAGIAGRWHHGCNALDPGYGGWMGLDHEISAAPWQFMAVKREVFFEHGTFDEGFSENGFECDLAIKLSHTGFKHVAIAQTSATFPENYPLKNNFTWKREDVELFRSKWPAILEAGDPYLNDHLCISDEGVSLLTYDQYLKYLHFLTNPNQRVS